MRTTPWLLCVALVAATSSASATPLDDVVAKNIAAQGGADKLAALQTVRLTGIGTFGSGDGALQAPFDMVLSKGRVRMEVTIQGLTQIFAYDGNAAWKLDPFGGRREAEKLSSDDLKGVQQNAEQLAPLYEAKTRGYKMELLAPEDVDGTQSIVVRISRADKDTQYIYVDPDTSLPIRIRTVSKIRGVDQLQQIDVGAYQQIAGVWIPMAQEVGDWEGNVYQHLTFDRVEANVKIDDAVFAQSNTMARLIVADPSSPALAVAAPPVPDRPAVLDSGTISGLGARNIGSATMSGRISAVAGRVDEGKTQLFIGAASGGVWRSLDGGTTFTPVFDKQPVQSIGAIAIDPASEGKTIWVGTGESWMRNSVSIGDGIYKSTDGGDTWRNMGLPESEHITKIVVNPKNGNNVFACVPGKLWSDSKDRGVYRTIDGGRTWTLVLAGANLSTGCSGLTLDPKTGHMLAGMWDFRRKGWTFRSGGESPAAPSGSGLYESSDYGLHWTSKATATGLPPGPWGRVEVTFAPSDARIVYAFIEGKASALYRSEDGGATWEPRDHSQHMVWRPFYFARLVVDPKDADHVFKPDLTLIVSEDGGATFSPSGGGSHGDWHDLWIDPTNSKHIVGGDDGGLWISYDGGNRWWKGANLPISQFYHVTVDNQDPYNVYGGLQDNSSWIGPSSYPGGISNARWDNLWGGDGFWVQPDPTDPHAVYAESQGGYAGRVDRTTLTGRDVQPTANYKEKLRFNWNTPMIVTKSAVYMGSQFLFRSTDKGMTWSRISPDLTTNDPAKQQQEQSGGVTVDNSSAEMHTTIYSISESPKAASTIWVGTDDGNVQLTRDAGKHWTNVTANLAGLPAASWVSWVEASRYDVATAYATFDRHSFGDMTPWVYRTTDAGKTWTRLPTDGVRGYAHVIKEDSVNRSLLFLGTELGLWVSTDAGATWAQFKGGQLPAVAVRDLAVQTRDGDLVIATHGRGLWVIDDLSPLRALDGKAMQEPAAFLASRPTQQRMPANGGWVEGDATFVGANPPSGATITYYLRTRHLFGPITIEILDGAGKVVDTVPASKRRGINRVQWSMQVKPPRVPRAASLAGSATSGPRVTPGTYTVRLTRGAQVLTTKLVIGLDRRAPYTVADRKAQYAAVMTAHALFERMSTLADQIDGVRGELEERVEKVPATDALGGQLRAAATKLDAIKKQIVATTEGGAVTGEERIREHLDTVYGAMMRWEGRPAKYQTDRVAALARELDDAQKEFTAFLAADVAPLAAPLKAKSLAPIDVSAAPPLEPLDDVALECMRSLGRDCEEEAPVAQEND